MASSVCSGKKAKDVSGWHLVGALQRPKGQNVQSHRKLLEDIRCLNDEFHQTAQ